MKNSKCINVISALCCLLLTSSACMGYWHLCKDSESESGCATTLPGSDCNKRVTQKQYCGAAWTSSSCESYKEPLTNKVFAYTVEGQCKKLAGVPGWSCVYGVSLSEVTQVNAKCYDF